jgi:hypothetical protein
MNVYVTSRRDETFEDGYAGIRYAFVPGKTVEIPVEAARHIFGYGDADKEPYLARLGWIRTKNDLPEGVKLLNLFEISEREDNSRLLSPTTVERVPLPNRIRAGGKPNLAA